MTSAPLDGLVVADFSRVLAGPLATMYLGDLGADVIKVEHPGGDDARRWGPPFVGEDSAYFMSANRNKRSIALDLSIEENRKAALALVDRADVLMENFRPGTMDRLGFSYEELSRRNPRLVYCSISGFGSGKGRQLAGYDFLIQAVGGLMSVTGEPDGTPMKAGVALVDVITGLHAMIGVLSALNQRQHTGRGQHVEVNLLSSLLASLVNQASTYLTTDEIPIAGGNRHPSIAPYESLAVGDRQLAVAVGNDRQFRELARVLGAPGLADDARFAGNAARVVNREELRARLEALLADRELDTVVAALSAAGVPAGPVNNVAEAFELATTLGLEPVVRIPSDARGEHPQVANPLTYSASAVSYRLPPPRLGEHTEEVLRWLQG
jgi:crotonobetainyl-CoA:carnitine CoA-transferase CaiB-like acyl-CoA transferase